jgi:hypothetical protein
MRPQTTTQGRSVNAHSFRAPSQRLPTLDHWCHLDEIERTFWSAQRFASSSRRRDACHRSSADHIPLELGDRTDDR